MKPKDLENKQKFRTGSSLVKGVKPNDHDIVVLYSDPAEYTQLLRDVRELDEAQAELEHGC